MTTQKPNESRKDYLLRVTVALLRENWEAAECTTDYDGTTCDGNCLADDIESELEESEFLESNAPVEARREDASDSPTD